METVTEKAFSEFLNLPSHSDSLVRRCRSCRMRFLEPYPNAGRLEQLYSEAYFTGGNDGECALPGSQVDYAVCAGLRMAKFGSTVRLLRRYIPPPAELLDVGAATGEFLDLARASGYRVAGVELSSFAAAKARGNYGLDIFTGALDEFVAPRLFEIVHLSHVLEHLVDPNRSVDQLASLLSPEGFIYVEVPFQWNLAERARFLFGHRQQFTVLSVHHRSFFRPNTLRSLFGRHGFSCRHLTIRPPYRYPITTLAHRVKWAAWQGISVAGQGQFIEAIFSRDSASARPGTRSHSV